MHDHDPTIEPSADLIDSELDIGMRAAFASDHDTSTVGGVLETLEQRLGVRSHVLLRDEPRSDPPTLPGRSDGLRRYEVHGEIARGGVGVVLKGRDVDLGREIAIKVLQERHAASPSMVQRFVEEAQITGQLQHPGILPIYEMGLQPDDRPFFTMRLIKGQTLAALLRERDGVDDDRPRFLSIFEHICQTVAYAHARGVIHRDLKPSNVMVGPFGEIQIVDWGLAKVLHRGGIADERPRARPEPDETYVQTLRTDQPGSQSIAGSIMGTPAYMAPEQARGAVEELDERSDVFALGGILCEILTGAAPFTGTSSEMIAASANGRLDDAHTRLDASGSDTDLAELTRRCLTAAAQDRPKHAGVVAEAITTHLASVDRRAREAEVAAAEARSRATQERRARRLTLALAGTVVVAIVVGALALLWVERDRANRIVAMSDQVNEVLGEASVLFGQAQVAPAGETAAWTALLSAGDRMRGLIDGRDVDQATRARVETFLAELARAHEDRRMIERIEELVIYGATHDDVESWLWMERELRAAYRDYGLDLDTMDRVEIAATIASSTLAAQLTNGLELWVATVFHLSTWNANPYPIEAMMQWVQTLLAADPDPYRTNIRRLLYSENPAEHVEELEQLARSPEFETALPTTMAWLAAVFHRSGQIERGLEVYKRALRKHPADPMLNFDCAYYLVSMERWEEATRYYHRAIAARPDSAGIWRGLARALRELGETEAALDAIDRSIEFQDRYAPTHIDRGATLDTLDRLTEAEAAFRRALELRPDDPLALCLLGRTLQRAGRLDQAVESLRRGHELGTAQPGWSHPSAEWLKECEEERDLGTEGLRG